MSLCRRWPERGTGARTAALAALVAACVGLTTAAHAHRRPSHPLSAGPEHILAPFDTRTEASARDAASVVTGRAARLAASLTPADAHARVGAALDDAALRCADFRPDALSFAERRGALGLPLTRGWQSAGFGPRRSSASRTRVRHTGLSFAAPATARAQAVAPGVVVAARAIPGWGDVVVVDHGRAYHSVYGHLAELTVERGAPVREGTSLGEIALRSAFDQRELYFELRYKGVPLDPTPWLRSR